jgi:hypothetical protein
MEKTQPEPWLRGTHRDIRAVPRAAIHAIELAEEWIICWCGQLRETEISATPCGLPSITVQLRHTESSRRIRQISQTKVSLEEPRFVGRRALPTSIGGLLVHVADHTQRHTGQAITTAKMLLAQRGR